MYKFKKELNLKINRTKASEIIGVSRPHLSKILNCKLNCSKKLAYCIAKFLNKEAEISDYFWLV